MILVELYKVLRRARTWISIALLCALPVGVAVFVAVTHLAPPPGQFIGDRPTPTTPDGPLADDDRTGARFLYPDPNDSLNVGAIRGQVLPANPFALATIAPSSPGCGCR